MRVGNLIALLIVIFMPALANAAAGSGQIPTKDALKTYEKQQGGKPIFFAYNATSNTVIDSGTIGIPSLEQLNEEIDKNNTLIEKKPLPNFKLPPSTKKIIEKLPSSLNKVRSSKAVKDANVKSSDFTGYEPERNQKLDRDVDEPVTKPVRPNSVFEIKISDTQPVEDSNALLMASKAYQVGQYESAIAIYKDALKTQPQNRDVLFGLATSYHKNKQQGQAKGYYAKLLELYPYDTEGQNNFLSLVAEEAPQDALNEFDILAKTNPGYAPIYAHKAMIYMKMGDDKNAIKNLYTALKLNEDNSSYKYNLAILFDKNGYYENANRLYSDLIEESMRGNSLPVSRGQIEDRVAFLRSKIKSLN